MEHKSAFFQPSDNSLTIMSVMDTIVKLQKTTSRVVGFASRAPDAEDEELVKAIDLGKAFDRTMERPDFSLAYPLVKQTRFRRIIVALPTESLRVLFEAALIANAEQAGLDPLRRSNTKSRTVKIRRKGGIVLCAKLAPHQPKNALTIEAVLVDDGRYSYQFRMH